MDNAYEALDAGIRARAARRDAGLCEQCGKRPGTQMWVGTEGTLAYTHGFYQLWCERCCTEAQIVYAVRRALSLPILIVRWLRELASSGQATAT